MAAPTEQRIAVPLDDPNADTEWNDILRKHQVIPEKPPSPTPLIEAAILEGRRLAHENRLEGKDLDELDELEDLEDDDFLQQYRDKRIRELGALHKASAHGSVYPVAKPDYSREVTEASHGGAVLVNLTSSSGGGGGGANAESALLSDLWRQAAREYGEVKFCEMAAGRAIENYPESNCPTILVYRNGDIVRQVVTLAEMAGVRTSLLHIDQLLVEVGAVQAADMRVAKRWREAEEAKSQTGEDDESD